MPRPQLRNNAGETYHLETPLSPWTYMGSTTYNTAFAAISAKVDVLQTDAAPAPQTDLSVGRWVFSKPKGSLAEIMLIGTDAANQTFSYRVWRWSQVVNLYDAGITQWHPNLVETGVVTLGAQTGVAGGVVVATQLYPDAMTKTATRSDVGNATNAVFDGPSTPDDNSCSLRIDPKGDALIEVEVTRNGGTAASIGLLVRGLTIL